MVTTTQLHNSVFDLFTETVEAYGCPLRVRGDRGTENTKVADYMINQGGSHSFPFICGRSVHNQRIERLWKDLFTGCTQSFTICSISWKTMEFLTLMTQ